MDNKITIELTEQEAELFLLFRKYQDYWEKIFKTRDGSVELHFDFNGEIRKVVYNSYEKVIHK